MSNAFFKHYDSSNIQLALAVVNTDAKKMEIEAEERNSVPALFVRLFVSHGAV